MPISVAGRRNSNEKRIIQIIIKKKRTMPIKIVMITHLKRAFSLVCMHKKEMFIIFLAL